MQGSPEASHWTTLAFLTDVKQSPPHFAVGMSYQHMSYHTCAPMEAIQCTAPHYLWLPFEFSEN